VHDSINEVPGEFTVGQANLEGGKITSNGVNNFKANQINSQDVHEYQSCSGFSVCGNVKDFKQDTQMNHLLPPDKQSAQITTTNLNFNNRDYQANIHSVIYGQEGTHIDFKESIAVKVSLTYARIIT